MPEVAAGARLANASAITKPVAAASKVQAQRRRLRTRIRERDVVCRGGRGLRNFQHAVEQVRHRRGDDCEHERLGARHIEPAGRDLVDALSPPNSRDALAFEADFNGRFRNRCVGLEVRQIDRELVTTGHRHEFEGIGTRLDTRQRLDRRGGGIAMIVALVRQRGPGDQDGQERHEPSNKRHVQSLRMVAATAWGGRAWFTAGFGIYGPCQATRFACRSDPVAHAAAVLGADAQCAHGRTLRLSEGDGTGGQPRSWQPRRGRPRKKPARGGDGGEPRSPAEEYEGP